MNASAGALIGVIKRAAVPGLHRPAVAVHAALPALASIALGLIRVSSIAYDAPTSAGEHPGHRPTAGARHIGALTEHQ